MDEAKWLKKKEKALKENNKDLLYESCKKLAEIYKEDGKYEESLSYFRRALSVCERNLDIAVLNRWIGEVYCDMEMFEEAIKYQKKHLELSKQEENNIEIQRALATLGRTYFIQALSHSNNKEKQKSLQTSYDYYLKSEETCDVLIGVSSQDLAMMKARLYLNIGLTLEALETTESSIDYLHKAVVISKAHDLYTELTQSYTRLAEVYLKQQKHSEALNTIKQCISVSNNRLDPNIFCELLLLRCDTHVDRSDFASAKMDLIQAYKLKHLSKINREEVEKKLKLSIVLMRNWSELLELEIQHEERNDVQQNQVKKIYEHLGDACAAFGNYGKAIHFYHKMLESCEAVIKLTYCTQLGIGMDDNLEECCTDLSGVVSAELCKDLVACYISLAQSYKDNKQYGPALDYFNRELSLHSRNYSEACKTLKEICDLYDLQEKPFTMIYETYQKALSLARENSDVKLEHSVLDSMRKLCKKHARTDELEEVKSQLKATEGKLTCVTSSEDEMEDSPDIAENINLEELSDLNSEEEKQAEESSRGNRKRSQRSHFLIKRNDKGETALHVAAARGNLSLVQSLLKQGHPVKVQDTVGWLPLHEAANHGHTDIVAALVEAGADPNDKGGTSISPLHDAAANGYLQVIECLLEKGASTAQRTDQGETALVLLEQCKARVERTQGCLDASVEAHFEQVVRKLRVPDALLGEDTMSSHPDVSEFLPSQTKRPLLDRNIPSQPKRPLLDQNIPSQPKRPLLDRNKCDDNMSSQARRSSSSERKRHDYRRELSLSDSSDEECATKEYQKAISNLRRQQGKFKDLGKLGHARVSQRQRQFLEEAEVGDDWLEEDMASSKKRKYNHEEGVQEHKRVRSGREVSSGMSVDARRKSDSPLRHCDSLEPQRKIYSIPSYKSAESQRIVTSTPSKESIETLRKFSSTSCYESAESEKKAPSMCSNKIVQSERKADSPAKRNPFEPSQVLFPEDMNDCLAMNEVDSSIAKSQETKMGPTISSKKIKIESHVFLIPLPNEASSTKIGWLKQEACERYYRVEGVRPVLRITTQDGALIDDQDPLASILEDPVVHTEVASWIKPPIVQRYQQLCSDSDVHVHHHFEEALTSTDTAVAMFNICSCAKSTPTIHTLFKTFLHWADLVELHLARSHLQDNDIQVLAQNMTGMTKLEKLNLSCNRIRASGMRHLSEHCAHLSGLRELDVSFNPLSSACLTHINAMVAVCPHLSNLNLSSAQLTVVESSMNLYNIRELNVSRNRLGVQQVQKLLSLLNAESLLSLSLSSTLAAPGRPRPRSPRKSPDLYLPDILSMVPQPGGITREVVLFLEQTDSLQVNRLELSDVDMRDPEASLLHQVFVTRGRSMLKLDVSCNPYLSHRLVQSLRSVVIQ